MEHEQKTYRNVCFTCFNIDEMIKLDQDFRDKWSYLVYGVEKCPTTGKTHYLGYVEFKDKQSLNLLKKLMPGTHFEKRKKSAHEAADYCKKDGIVTEYGHISQLGKRNDLCAVADAVKEGKNIVDIAFEFPVLYIKYNKGIEKLQCLIFEKMLRKMPNVIVLYGKSGSGKSHWAYTNFPNACWVSQPQNGCMWYDNYRMDKFLVFDEFHGWITIDMFKRILDKFPLTLPTKGGFVPCIPDTIIFTSKEHPKEWYKNMHVNDVDAFYRRISEIIEFCDKYEIGLIPNVVTQKSGGNTNSPRPAERQLFWNKRL